MPCSQASRTFAAALLSASLLTLGPHAVFAQSPTETRLSLSSETSLLGEPVTLTATVDALGHPAPRGSVSFSDGETEIGVAVLEVLGIEGAGIEAAGWHSCALSSTGGRVFCWGMVNGSRGRDRLTPVTVSGLSDVADIAVGGDHSCALTTGGRVYCWGADWLLGGGTTTDRMTPVPVSGLSDVARIAAGYGHSCALTTGGQVFCWGWNIWGQLGDGTRTDRLTPVPVSGLSDVADIAAGTGHSCALTAAGRVFCWGRNDKGELGDGTTTERLTPVPVGVVTGVTQVSTGGGHSCALTTAGRVFCWGQNVYGQLGDGSTTNRLTPVPVSSLSDVADIAAGGLFSCALTTGGRVFCSGRNDRGQLGTGTTANSSVPVPVSGLSLRTISRADLTTAGLPLGLRSLRAVYAGSVGLSPSSSEASGHLVHDRTDLAPQVISFDPMADRIFARDATATLSATSSSGLPVSFSSLTPSVCTVVGDSATLLSVGTCRIESTQPGNDVYLPAVPKRQSFDIARGEQTISFLSIGTQGLTDGATVELSATASSGLPVVFASLTPAVCTTSGATAALLALGQCRIAADQPGDSNYLSAPRVTQSFFIRPPTTITLTGPATGVLGESLTFVASLTSDVETPIGAVSFLRNGTVLASAPLDASGVARASIASLPEGTHQITARYPGDSSVAPATSAPLSVTITVLDIGFIGGGSVFAQTEACAPVLGDTPHPVTLRYSPSELGGLPSGVSIAWREGSEHLALWGPMGVTEQFFGGAGRATWTRFVFYPTRPLIRVVQRQITNPGGGTDLATAQELVMRLRVQNFAAVPGCSVTIAATLRRAG